MLRTEAPKGAWEVWPLQGGSVEEAYLAQGGRLRMSLSTVLRHRPMLWSCCGWLTWVIVCLLEWSSSSWVLWEVGPGRLYKAGPHLLLLVEHFIWIVRLSSLLKIYHVPSAMGLESIHPLWFRLSRFICTKKGAQWSGMNFCLWLHACMHKSCPRAFDPQYI